VVGRVEPEAIGDGLVEQDRRGGEVAYCPVQAVVQRLA
jgi:hypothetical protein